MRMGIEVDFWCYEWCETTMGDLRNMTKLLNVNYTRHGISC